MVLKALAMNVFTCGILSEFVTRERCPKRGEIRLLVCRLTLDDTRTKKMDEGEDE